MDKKISDIILKNEESLLTTPTRYSYDHLNKLLDDDFIEFGSSGNIYRKQDILARLPQENNFTFTMENILIKQIDEYIFLLTYKVKKMQGDGQVLASLRSSLWKKFNMEFKLLFHQGTPIAQPKITDFKSLIKRARKQAQATGLKKRHVKKAITEIRKK